ncbi:MAG: hypothetical protein IJ041_07955, partial [Clostridia bacterium]|nr:hypothetical protein [Clostridia bacterium]
YACSRPNPEGKTDRLEVAFNMDGEEVRFYVDADELMYFADEVLDSKLADWEKNSKAIFFGGNEAMPLLPVRYTLVETEPTEAPEATEEPAAPVEPEAPETTEEPAPEVTEEPAAPVVTEEPVVTAEPTAEPTKAPELVEIITPEVSEPAEEETEDPGDKTRQFTLSQFEGKTLWTSRTDKYKVVYNATTGGGVLPESAHPYGNNRDDVYKVMTGEICARITIKFSADTAVESNFDLLLVYDAAGKYVAGYTGKQAAGKTLYVPGNCVYIRLLTDNSNTNYGFSLDTYNIYQKSKFKSVTTNADGHVTLTWELPKSTTSYQLQRADINQSTGATGMWKTLKEGGTATSYTDTTTVKGKAYNYRLRVYSTVGGTKYYAQFVNYQVYIFSPVTITGYGAVGTINTTPDIEVTWKKVAGATSYNILRSELKAGPYAVIAVAGKDDTSYLDVAPEHRGYFYKVEAVKKIAGKQYSTMSDPKFLGYPLAPNKINAIGKGPKTVKLSWNKPTGARGYAIYRSTSPTSGFKQIDSSTVNSYEDTKAVSGKVNYYKIRTYTRIGTKNIYGLYSDVVAIFPLAQPKVTAEIDETGSVKLSWKAVAHAQDYEIYHCDTHSGTYKLMATSATTSCVLTDLDMTKEYAYFYVKAVRIDTTALGDIISESANSDKVSVALKAGTVNTVYRAVLISQTYAGSDNETLYSSNNVSAMNSMLTRMTGTPYTIYSYSNLSSSSIISTVTSVAGNADDDDITLIYFSGLGENGGYLLGTDGWGVSPYELRRALDGCLGKKIIIVDANTSGGLIGKEAGSSNFASAFTGAFASQSRSGYDLAGETYFVLASSSSTQNAVTSNSSAKPPVTYGVFTNALTYMSGWDCFNKKALSTLGADDNGDKMITLSELYWNTMYQVDFMGFASKQTIQCYPAASGQVLFGK